MRAGAFVVVNVEGEGVGVRTILDVLEPCGIPVEVVGRAHQIRRTASVVVRVPPDRVAEAMVALEAQGFADLLAYQVDESPLDDSPIWSAGGAGEEHVSRPFNVEEDRAC